MHSHQIEDASFHATLPNEEEFEKEFVNEPPSRILTETQSEVKEAEIVDALSEKESPAKEEPKQEY